MMCGSHIRLPHDINESVTYWEKKRNVGLRLRVTLGNGFFVDFHLLLYGDMLDGAIGIGEEMSFVFRG